ncbi:alpha-hydroxy acid oxidase [Sphingobacterium chuzhouense]|uniref:Alpha-hydroxy-acid oxidizing protein n=2 Tax=Sphingobacterium chuzhouense TaxID=1742264 RepID=A0ABR7XT21_9SPHI|nr:alpha-hydroxy acid oxidase [Sphingobacterium chuzhouense]MBD1422323.1 alpha-hydroxy-acid oxidizing protein [Sphingobacterium chuzhouense]
MIFPYNHKYPSITDLRRKAKKTIPKFAFDYLEGGCNEELNLSRNENDFDDIFLKPRYLQQTEDIDMSTEIFGIKYQAPFGISPIGLQGLIWPNASEILAKAAAQNGIPYTLSTVSTASLERISEVSEGTAWFQLYHPTEDKLRDDILKRLKYAQYPVLVVLVDVPSFGLRYREIKSGLSLPPKLNISNILQALLRPSWGIKTLQHGIPSFATLKPYMEKRMNLSQLGEFMNHTFTGKVTLDKLKVIREKWKGPLVLKGITTEEDMDDAIRLGADGVIISNHGGRQLDAGESSVNSLIRLAANPLYKGKLKIMLDGGIRSGVDLARAHAVGTDFSFMGRPFMYGVGALGNFGGHHTINMFKAQLYQIMQQVSISKPTDFPRRRLNTQEY